MPTWGELLIELNELKARMTPPTPGQPSPWDILRRKYLLRLADSTKRAVITYESAWLETPARDADSMSVHWGDVQGFMEAVSNVEERNLDLFLHSAGGSAEAAESIMDYLRTRFDHIRAIVPVAAMSAATMMALGADEIVMGAHSQLGPIDPQIILQTPEGPRGGPGQAILDQFELAKQEIAANPQSMLAWMPILRYYGPGLVTQIRHHQELAEQLVAGWLEQYMFKGFDDRHEKAGRVAHWFNEFRNFGSHGRRVGRDQAKAQGLHIVDLEDVHDLQDAMLSVHHACQLTFGEAGALKIIENHHGRAWMKSQTAVQLVPQPAYQQQPPQQQPAPARRLPVPAKRPKRGR